MATYRVSMILADDPTKPLENRELVTKFAGCKSEEEAKSKARKQYAPRVVSIKWAKVVQE